MPRMKRGGRLRAAQNSNGKTAKHNGNGKVPAWPLSSFSFDDVDEKLGLIRDLLRVLAADLTREVNTLKERADEFSDEHFRLSK